jgi:putative restriction endonuclease
MSTGQQPGNYRNVAYYCDCFSKIKVYKNKKRGGNALNQPILLLSVIDLISNGFIKDNHIKISDELIDTFKRYWAVLGSDSFEDSDFSLPFFHLKNKSFAFWNLDYNSHYYKLRETDDKIDDKIRKSTNSLDSCINHAYIDNELFDFLKDISSRQELVDTLVTVWFEANQNRIDDILGVNQAFQDSLQEEIRKLEESESRERERSYYQRKAIARNPFFGKAVVHAYDYRCAFCHLKVTRSITQNIVDGAHIQPIARFFKNNINNGISFCKNHHWAFDRGWFYIDSEYRLIIASDLEEESQEESRCMNAFQNHKILLPTSKEYWPDTEALKWHRKYVFKKNKIKRIKR